MVAFQFIYCGKQLSSSRHVKQQHIFYTDMKSSCHNFHNLLCFRMISLVWCTWSKLMSGTISEYKKALVKSHTVYIR